MNAAEIQSTRNAGGLYLTALTEEFELHRLQVYPSSGHVALVAFDGHRRLLRGREELDRAFRLVMAEHKRLRLHRYLHHQQEPSH